MDVLRPGHAHRSSSDRLLSNYLDSQKNLNQALLTLLSHSHASSSSFLAYVTSSPGVIPPVRRSVRHAGFEGPITGNGPVRGSALDDGGEGGWAAYLASLDRFRKDLKQIHLLEEEIARVRRDREILVSRLIKTTKSRPTRSDLSAIASGYRDGGSVLSSRASITSGHSNSSAQTKEGKRAVKLADAQAELLGCEEHLRDLEVRLEHERNKVMLRGLEEKFRAMDAVAKMWLKQARAGMAELDKMHELPADAFEVDSNGSIAPSQSASQIAYEDMALPPRVPRIRGPGSITGSIAEEDEGSSGDERQGNLVVHENRNSIRTRGTSGKPSPLRNNNFGPTLNGIEESSDDGQPYGGGGRRRTASDVGAMRYKPPQSRASIRRTNSVGGHQPLPVVQEHSDAGSVRSNGSKKKKRGFFASIGRFFKGSAGGAHKRRDGRNSPTGSRTGGTWSTRTNDNLRRQHSGMPRRGVSAGDDSSSDDDNRGPLVSVANNGGGAFDVSNVGRPSSRAKRTSSTPLPVARGLIPDKPTRSDLGAGPRSASQTTLTKPKTGTALQNRMASPGPRVNTPSVGRGTPIAAGAIARSNTMRSTKSGLSTATAGTVKSSGTVKSNNTAVKRASLPAKTSRPSDAQQAAAGRNIMSLVDSKSTPSAPVMPDIPKAPRSQLTPQMELAKAPGSSLVLPSDLDAAKHQPTYAPEAPMVQPKIKRSASHTSRTSAKPSDKPTTMPVSQSEADDEDDSPKKALQPSRMLSPPLKSALRPSTPAGGHTSPPPQQSPVLAPPIAVGPMYTITAPGPVQLTPEAKPAPAVPGALKQTTASSTAATVPAPRPVKRHSFNSQTTDGGNSVYEDAEDGATMEGSGSESEDDGGHQYDVVVNEKIERRGEIARGHAVERIPGEVGDSEYYAREDDGAHYESDGSEDTATGRGGQGGLSVDTAGKRKSVRMDVPPSPAGVLAPGPIVSPANEAYSQSREAERAPSPEPQRVEEPWNTRIGQQDETSDDDGDDEYRRARRGLQKNTGAWEAVKDKVGKGGKKAGSVRSKGSRKSGRA